MQFLIEKSKDETLEMFMSMESDNGIDSVNNR